jgi:hypothetical protein
MRFLITILSSLLFAVNAYSAELSGSEEAEQATDSAQVSDSNTSSATSQCSPAEVQENQAILTECSAKWSTWGVNPPPPASELRDPNNCAGMVSVGTLEGCGDALVALPIFMAEMGLRGMLATLPTDKNTLAYVSQNGSQAEIAAFLTNEFMEETCGISQVTESVYIDNKCEQSVTTNSHTATPEASRTCRQQGLAEVQAAAACRRSGDTRGKYRAIAGELRARAQAIKETQDEKRRMEAQFQSDLADIKNSCGVHMNPLRGSMLKYIAPFSYLAKEMQNAAAPRPSEIQAFNDCVERKTVGNLELRKALVKQSTGLMAQIAGSFSALKCYNERERKKLMCEVALGVLSGGAGLTAALARKLGPGALRGARRFTGRADNIATDTAASGSDNALSNVVQRNAQLNDADRITAAKDVLNRPNLTAYEQQSIIDAHNVGSTRPGAGVGNYTQAELAEKTRILNEAGFSTAERRQLMEAGITGQTPGTSASGTVLTGRMIDNGYGRQIPETTPYVRPAGYPASATNDQIRGNMNVIQSKRTALQANPNQPDNARLLAQSIEIDQRLKSGSTEMTDELRGLYQQEARNLDAHYTSTARNGRNRDPLDVSNAYADYAAALPAGPQRDAAIAKSVEYRDVYAKSDAYRRETARITPPAGSSGERVSEVTVHGNDFAMLRAHAQSVSDPLARARAQAQMDAISAYARSQKWNMQYFTR